MLCKPRQYDPFLPVTRVNWLDFLRHNVKYIHTDFQAWRLTVTTIAKLVPGAAPQRFDGIERPYGPEDVARLRGSLPIRHTLAEHAADRLWKLLAEEPYVNALGALSGNQAMQMVRAGLKAIYLSGWQVAADANTAGAMYPDQSLYPANSGPGARQEDQSHATACRSDRDDGGEALRRHLVRPDRR